MNKELNLDVLNEMICQAMGDEVKKSDLIMHELTLAMAIRLDAVDDLINVLNSGKDYSDALDRVNTIDTNTDRLGAKYEQALKDEDGE